MTAAPDGSGTGVPLPGVPFPGVPLPGVSLPGVPFVGVAFPGGLRVVPPVGMSTRVGGGIVVPPDGPLGEPGWSDVGPTGKNGGRNGGESDWVGVISVKISAAGVRGGDWLPNGTEPLRIGE